MFFDQYPYTNMHNVNLDWVLQAVKSWGAMVEQNNQNFINLEAANQSFKEYVTNYITNLDVQEEINHKLDQMLASGALTQYFAPYIKTDVEDWLEENITPTTPAIDASLSIAGAAADAKAAGDRVTAVEESISDVVDSELENINNAIYTLSDYVGAPYQRRALTDDLTVTQGAFTVNSDGDIVCTEDPATPNATIIQFGDIVALSYSDANELVSNQPYGPRVSRICLAINPNIGYKQFSFKTTGYAVTGVGEFIAGAVTGGGAVQGVVTPFDFPDGNRLKSVVVRKESDRFTFVIKDTADNQYNVTILYSQIGITYEDAFIYLANINTRFTTLVSHHVVNNVMVTVPGSGEVIDQTNPMFDKSWIVYGDSYSAPSQTIRKYPEIICDQTGCNYTNYAISGHRASEILSDMTNNPATTDDTIITVFLGYNDYADSTPLATFTADLEAIISKAMEFNINANIGIIATTSCGAPATGATGDCTAPNREGLNLEDYVNAIVSTCHEHMVSVLDLYHDGQFYGTIAAFKAIYLNSGDGYLHPTQAGQVRIAGVIKKWMLYELVLD